MTITFPVTQAWKTQILEVVYADGAARAQVVIAAINRWYYALL